MDLARWVRETILPTLLVVVGSLVPSSPQAAGDHGFDVSRIRAADLRITSDRCREVPLHVWFTTAVGGGTSWKVDFSADVDVRRGTRSVGRTHVSRSMTRPSGDTARTTDPYLWCPTLDRLGTFRVGPSRVDAEIYDRSYSLLADAAYRDSTSTTFSVRQGSVVRLSITRVQHRRHRAHTRPGQKHRRHGHVRHGHRSHRHGRAHHHHARHHAEHHARHGRAHHRHPHHRHGALLHRFRVAPWFYSVHRSAWTPWRGRNVMIQRRTRHGWTKVRIVRTSRHGVATLALRTRRGQRFRAVVRGTSVTWGAESPVRRSR